MNADQIEISRQLANLPGFWWTQGMRNVSPDGSPGWWTHTGGPEHSNLSPWYGHGANHDPSEGLPGLTDDATGGVLLGWLARMELEPVVDHNEHGWTAGVVVGATHLYVTGATLADACARALVMVGRCPPNLCARPGVSRG